MVVWTQSNILGPQNGANMGDDYSHQHMLRQYVTPLWGDTLQSPAKGTYFARDYTITLPEELNDAQAGESFQFVRMGYYAKDPDSTAALPVFNRVVGLKDSFKIS